MMMERISPWGKFSTSLMMAVYRPALRASPIRTASPYGWPQDAIDGALIALHTTGHLRASYKGAALAVKQLDQAKISATDFRVETATLRAKDRIRLRGLFQAAGVACKSGDEGLKADEFLTQLVELADQAGGDPPMPPRPATAHVETLRALAGNEQLVAILDQSDALTDQAKQWTEAAGLAAKRKPAWDTLCALLKHAGNLPEAVELRTQADAVRDERRLLEKTDPFPAIHKAAAAVLRTAVKAAHGAFVCVHKDQLEALTSSGNWKKLTAAQQEQVLAAADIGEAPALSVGNDTDLLRTLEGTALPAWRTKTDALPQQFANAALAAAKLLEPKTQRIHVTSGTLKTSDDVRAWLAETETTLTKRLADGPVIIS